MHIIYENEYGMISMGEKQSPWRLISIKGLNIPEKSHSVVRYGNFGGQQTVFSVPDARIITISGDFYSENIGAELCNALRIFNSSGTLSVISGDKQRLIKCSQITFEEIERKRCYLRFALQFVCDNPYFNDLFPNVTGIFERKGSLKNSFTLPCSFSTRNSNKDGVPFEVVNPRPSKELLEALQEGEDILNGKVKAKSYTNMYEMLKDLKA